MINNICFAGPSFSVNGKEVFFNEQPDFQLLFNNEADKNSVIGTEWYMDGKLIMGLNGLNVSAQVPNGDYLIGARVLAVEGWSGIKYFKFLNVNTADYYRLTGPGVVEEGQTVAFEVWAMYKGESIKDTTYEYSFSCTEGAFHGNLYTIPQNSILGDSRLVTISAFKNGRPLLSKEIQIVNTTQLSLNYVSVTGPSVVYEESSDNSYILYAHFNDGSVLDMTAESTFTLLHAARGQFENNRLNVFSNTVNGDSVNSTISGFYRFGDKYLSATIPVSIVDTTPVQLVSLSVNGPTAVDEGSTQNVFLVYAHYSDGSSADKTSETSFSFSASGRGTFSGNKLSVFANETTADGTSAMVNVSFNGLSASYPVEIIDRSVPVVLNEFDYMTVRFGWLDGAGADLDILVAFEGTGTAIDGQYVGWGGGGDTVPRVIAEKPDAYLWWAADNTGSTGYEAVLIGIKKFINDFPATNNMIDIVLYANWYRSVNTGNFSIELVTYLGGTMSASGTELINTGGQLLFSDSFAANTQSYRAGANPNAYARVAKISYNKILQKGTVQIFENGQQVAS